MAAKKQSTESAVSKGGIEIKGNNLILTEEMASAIWNDWKPGM